jgi:DHA1 family bicyclomycin/chloramphenicol resistance-like MFS transporter
MDEDILASTAPPPRAAARSPTVGFAAALGAVTLIGPLAVHFFVPVVPEIQTAFGISDALAELTFSITLVTMAVSTLVYGTLSDRFGRRPLLISGLALFLVGSILCALAPTIEVLLAGRLVQALGAGCGITLTRVMARDAYGPGTLVKAIAYLTMAYTLGPMIAPPLGGVLDDHFGWRAVFWFALIAGAAITALAFGALHETRRGERRQSASGILRDYVTLFANLRFTAFVLQSGFCSGTFFAIVAASPFLMEDRLGRSATEYGFYFILFPAGYCLGNLISVRVAGRAAIETMVLAGSVLNLLAMAVQGGLILGGTLDPLVIFVPGFFITFAQGLALPNAQAGAIQVVPALSGTAAGIGVFCQTILSALFVQIYGWVADGTAVPMIATSAVAAVLACITGAIPMICKGRQGAA